MKFSIPSIWKKTVICCAIGFSSGLPLYFMLNLIPVWLKSDNIDLKVIGLMSLIQLPYTLKFLWAPFLDGFTLPFLGRRRGWMLLSQLILLLVMMAYSLFRPSENLNQIILLSLLLTFASATQDIVIDAFRREILLDEELGLGNAIHVNAYRIAALIPGSLSLVLSEYFSWSTVFVVTALFMIPGVILTLCVKEPPLPPTLPKNLQDTVVLPFREFFTRHSIRHSLLILLFILFYKLGDSMATALASPFYLDMGFSRQDIGLIAKNAGLWPAVIAAIVGGVWMIKLGINRALWIFGVVQALSILGFMWLASEGPFDTITGHHRAMLALVIAFEAVGVGLGTAAFVAFIARETHPAYTATQLALLTALSAVPRTVINALVGYLIELLGYVNFFGLCFLLALPGMLLLFVVAPWNALNVIKLKD